MTTMNPQPMQLQQPAPASPEKQATAVRDQTAMEELFNALSHGVGLVLAIASLPILVYSALQKGQAANVVGACLFAGTAIVLYLISTLYHALPMGRAKAWFNRLDHAPIYLFIAGSYMPFLFGVLRGPWGWTLFGAICAAAVWVWEPSCSTGCCIRCGRRGFMWRWAGWR